MTYVSSDKIGVRCPERENMLITVYATYLRNARERKPFEAQVLVLARSVAQLALVYPGGRQRRQRHAVSQEYDHVLGRVGLQLHLQLLVQHPLAVVHPELGLCK